MKNIIEKCKRCGAILKNDQSSFLIVCEYCGQEHSHGVINAKGIYEFLKAKYSSLNIKRQKFNRRSFFNLFSRLNPLNLSNPQKNLLIFIPSSILLVFLIREIRRDRWFEHITLNDSDIIEAVYLKKGKWSKNKTFRNYDSRVKFNRENNPIREEKSIVNCEKWQYRERDGIGKWKEIIILSNWHYAMSTICEKPQTRWKLVDRYLYKGKKQYFKAGFWREDRRYRDFTVKSKNDPFKDHIKADADCDQWKIRWSGTDEWDHYHNPQQGGYMILESVCEKEFKGKSSENNLTQNDNGTVYLDGIDRSEIEEDEWIYASDSENGLKLQVLEWITPYRKYIAVGTTMDSGKIVMRKWIIDCKDKSKLRMRIIDEDDWTNIPNNSITKDAFNQACFK